MLDKRQEQGQSQSVNISSEKHGVVDEIHCPYYTDERAEWFKNCRYRDSGAEAVKNKELYFKSQLVKVLIYEGKTSKVFCRHLDTSANKCNSPLRESEGNKNCYIIS